MKCIVYIIAAIIIGFLWGIYEKVSVIYERFEKTQLNL